MVLHNFWFQSICYRARKTEAHLQILPWQRVLKTWSQSYDFWIYRYNASVVVGRLEHFSKYIEENYFVFKTRGVVTGDRRIGSWDRGFESRRSVRFSEFIHFNDALLLYYAFEENKGKKYFLTCTYHKYTLGNTKYDSADQGPILPKVTSIGFQIFVTGTLYIFVTFNEFSLVGQVFFQSF
jgi:hypothetical protein